MNKFHSENEEYYNNTKPVSNIALVWSMESANYYSSSVAETDFTKKETLGSSKAAKGNHYKAFMGLYEMLTRSHAQFDVIDDVNLKTSDLGKYEMLILPTCGCMSREVLSGLKKYVKNGGKVLSTYDTGFYSGKGTYKGPDEISDLLGIKGIREVVRYNLSGTAYQKVSNSSYNNELDYHLIPAPELALRCDAADGAKVDTEFLEPMPGRYVALPEEGFPGIIVNSYGSGKSIYICGTLGEYYYEKTHPSLRQLLSGILDKETSALLRTNAPGSVEMVLRKKDSDIYILHAVNMTGDMTRPIERILPVTDINVTIRSEKAPISIKSLMSGMEIPFTFDKSAINFVIDKIDYFEPLVISFA
jgi:beta-galactosidase GanA